MIKIAFLDIDGTLLSFKTQEVPGSSWRAIEALRIDGIKTVICTGRSFTEVPSELRSGFDAYVTMNGQRCFAGEDVYRSIHIDESDVRVMVEQVERGLYDVVVKLDRGEGYAFINCRSSRIRENELQVGLSHPIDDVRLALVCPVYQFCAFVDREDEHIFLDVTKHLATTRWNPLFCDVVPAGGGKDCGVRATLDYFGFTREEAVAIGDAENDLPMFQAVGTRVAMGNACDDLKELADFVTDDVDSDGLWNACCRLGLV